MITSTLNIHLNIGQNITMNSSSVFMSLETISFQSLSNKVIKPIGNAQMKLPSNLYSNNSNGTISLRVCYFFSSAFFPIISFFHLVNDVSISFG